MKVWVLSSILIFACGCTAPRPFGSALTAASSEAPLTGCALEEQGLFDAFNTAQLQWYTDHGAAVPIPEYRSRIYHGTNGRAVVVANGYASSPYTLVGLMEGLHAAGYTVIAPLLNGYGSTDDIANSSTPDDWYRSVTAGVAIAQHCHSDISLMALSLGATVSLNGLLNHGLTGISHVITMSAFLQPSNAVSLVDTSFYPGVPSLSITTLETLTGGIDPYSYLPYDPPPAGAPPTSFPVIAMHTMLTLAQSVLASSVAVSPVPAMEVVSDADGIMNVPASLNFMSAHFSSVVKVEYPSSDGIGHSLEQRSGNPHFDQLVQQILSFLGSST